MKEENFTRFRGLSLNVLLGILFISLFVVLAIFGIISFRTYNIIPAKFLLLSVIFFSFFIILLFSLTKFRFHKDIVLITIISMIYLMITYINSVLIHKNYFLDYIVEYLSFIYLIIIAFLYNKIKINLKQFKIFFKILIFLFLIKYSISQIFGLMSRPGIFTENNYELLFLSLLILAYYHIFRNLPIFLIILLAIIYILAESRSGILLFSILLIFMYADFSKKRNFFIFIIIFIFSIISILIVFKYRMANLSIENVDRFHFLMIFLKEIQDWNFFDFMFGKHPLSPLSYESCKELSFYKSLFSYSGENICYSVILHSFLLRVIFDHGILGFLFLFSSIYRIILISGYSKKESFLVLVLLFINGISVSSLNNVFTLAGILFLTNLGYHYKKKGMYNVSKTTFFQTSR